MRIIFSKARGVPVLTCTRDDGTTTYSKSAHGAFFGPHDLMHYALESVLDLRDSFFGLIARGRSIEWFAQPGAAQILPAEANHTEMMVNQLMQEQAFGPVLDAGSFNAAVAASLAAGRRTEPAGTIPVRRVTDDELREVRARFAHLIARYAALRDGERLELPFPG